MTRLLPLTKWNYIFPIALPFFTYEGFINAIAYYPSFCNEKGKVGWWVSLDQVCKKELATLFAHFNQETGGHWPAGI